VFVGTRVLQVSLGVGKEEQHGCNGSAGFIFESDASLLFEKGSVRSS